MKKGGKYNYTNEHLISSLNTKLDSKLDSKLKIDFDTKFRDKLELKKETILKNLQTMPFNKYKMTPFGIQYRYSLDEINKIEENIEKIKDMDNETLNALLEEISELAVVNS